MAEIALNRQERRKLVDRAKRGIHEAKAWIAVVFDGTGIPMFWYDVTALKDKKDIRHHAMRKMAGDVTEACRGLMVFREKQVAEYRQNLKIQAAKDKRSEELEKAGGEEENAAAA